MTMPHERTRALRWAGEFLREVMQSPECPPALKHQAYMILRHYPEPHSIAHEARYSDHARQGVPWLGPEDPPTTPEARDTTAPSVLLVSPEASAKLLHEPAQRRTLGEIVDSLPFQETCVPRLLAGLPNNTLRKLRGPDCSKSS